MKEENEYVNYQGLVWMPESKLHAEIKSLERRIYKLEIFFYITAFFSTLISIFAIAIISKFNFLEYFYFGLSIPALMFQVYILYRHELK